MKKNLLTIVVLALVLVNIVLSIIMMISVTTTNSKTSALVTTIMTVMNLELTDGTEESAVEPISLADTEVYAIADQMTIALQSVTTADGKVKTPYMVCHISLQINKTHPDYKTMQPLVATNETLIKDAIRTIISSKTEEECRTNEEGLKAEILKAIQDLFGSDFIYAIAISDTQFG
ncbi:MAG: flagellar basal body-associated FliL family protein [Lachnospiraceae bacterium]|nr:flagellar basal body-associated FliL family protein [Lachnospiraceae bacterium]